MIVTVHVKPRARKNELAWLDADTAKASVSAAAERGKANEAVIGLLADHFKIAPTRISIVRGATVRIKQLYIPV
jgi:uncharacterized protein YggU (UPF0235/DUF167 family)